MAWQPVLGGRLGHPQLPKPFRISIIRASGLQSSCPEASLFSFPSFFLCFPFFSFFSFFPFLFLIDKTQPLDTPRHGIKRIQQHAVEA
jgi:hypothetical protein